MDLQWEVRPKGLVDVSWPARIKRTGNDTDSRARWGTGNVTRALAVAC
ncbi:MAG: hypothetical protein ACE15D_00115 [Candidatus Eisenbacteria bacterium]